MHPLRFTVPAIAFVACLACSNHSGASQASAGTARASSASTPPAPVTASASVAAAAGSTLAAPIATDAADAGAPAPAGPPPPKVVLHLGDSMVGGFGGLTKALEAKFKALGAQFHSDTQVSLSIQTFDHEHKLQDLVARWHPDLLILTLGANDVLVPFPASLASSVQSIARKASAGRDCYWITPAPWRKDTGIIDVVKKNAAPCKVYDSGPLRIARGGDGIHPTDGGGVVWADGFWAFYQSGGAASPPALLDGGAP
jgi:acyl-CoA thioesterase-1